MKFRQHHVLSLEGQSDWNSHSDNSKDIGNYEPMKTRRENSQCFIFEVMST